MRYYEYDSQGWLVGGYNAESPRPNSTPIAPAAIAPCRARWNGSSWIEDAARETQAAADEQAERTRRQQATTVLRNFDEGTATLAQTRNAVAATRYLLREIFQELKS